MPIIAAFCAAVLAIVAYRRHRLRDAPATAVILSPQRSTVVARDGGVRSVQSAEFSVRERDLERLWNPENLENLARTYWVFLSRVTLGLIRVIYGENERRVALLIPQLTLLRFEAPQYEIERNRGSVRWRIRDGLLVARSGRGCGFLQIEVKRERPPGAENGNQAAWGRLHMEIEVANFYPSIASNFSLPVYMATQSWIHVVVTHGFLRSLSHLDLEQSRVGSLRQALTSASRRARLPHARQP